MAASISKRRLVQVGLFAMLAIALGWYAVGGSRKLSPVQFVGLANDSAKAQAAANEWVATFRKMDADRDAAIARWITAGTNVGVFRIVNYARSTIEVFPTCRLYFKDEPGRVDYLPLLNATTASGFQVSPGQSTTVEVPLLPNRGRWRTQFVYHTRNPFSLINLVPFRGGMPGRTLRSPWLEPLEPVFGLSDGTNQIGRAARQ